MVGRLKRLVSLLLFIFILSSQAYGSNSCGSVFGQDAWESLFVGALDHLKLSTSEYSNIYTHADTSHPRLLNQIFKVPFSSNKPMPTVKSMINNYVSYMNRLVDLKVVDEENVLYPVFVFEKNKEFIVLNYGDPIPEGAKLHKGLLPPDIFKSIVAKGFFPIGSDALTTTSITALEHDLAHLTGFIESPQYMVAIHKNAQRDVEVEESYLTAYSRKKREYFISESLVIVRPEHKQEMLDLLILSAKMKANPSQVTYNQILAYLKGTPTQSMINIANRISYRYERYLLNLGGASRDPLSSVDSILHTPIRGFISLARNNRATPLQTITAFAKMQYVLLKLSQIELNDWFLAAQFPYTNVAPAVRELFKEPEIWKNHSDLYGLF